MFTVCVIDEKTGRPASGRTVTVVLLTGSGSLIRCLPNQYTDSRGEVRFSLKNKKTFGGIDVDGKSVYKGYLFGRQVVYV